MTDLALLVPSRGRPDNVRRLLAACRDTAPDVHVVIGVDGDDPCLDDYREAVLETIRADRSSSRALRIHYDGPDRQRGMVPVLNEMAAIYAERYWAVGFMGDDHLPRTVGWDRTMLDELVEMGNTGLVYGNDLFRGEGVPTALVMTSDIPLTLGYMAHPSFGHMYVDDAWLALGRALGRIAYLPDVVIQHLHPDAGTAPSDTGYTEVNAWYPDDKQAYDHYLREHLDKDVAKIRAMIEARTARG